MKQNMLKKAARPAILILLLWFGWILLRNDYIPFLQWWGVVLILGLTFMPLTGYLFSGFKDGGFLFSKTIGIALAGYMMWFLSSVHLLKFTGSSCIIVVAICLVLNIILLFWKERQRMGKTDHKRQSLFDQDFSKKKLAFMFTEELLLFGLFVLFTYVRCFKPEAYGTEKFMDYGFMTSMMRSNYMPPQDFWFCNTNLNYYYVGQYLATFLTKLSFVKVSDGYNLMLMMTGAFAFVLPYSLGYHVISSHMEDREKKKGWIAQISGLLAGSAVCLAGNMHYPVYKWLVPGIRKLIGLKNKAYWFPDATRYIGYNPDTHDKTIHEFPSYSFVLGDLHAHVVNILFVITVVAILFAWQNSRKNLDTDKLPVWKEIFHPAMIVIGFFIGLFHMTNFWDFPIYFVVSGAVILFCNLVVYDFKRKVLWLTALEGIFIMAFSELIALPFTLKFDKIVAGIRIVDAQTPLYQLTILWGLPFFMVIAFICFLIAKFVRERKKSSKTTGVLSAFMKSISTADLFILTLGLCAMGLIYLPEVIYVQDIYSGDYKRANTMFKLTYQAFIMFGICDGYLMIRLLFLGETKRQKKVAITGLVLFLMSLCYIQNAVNAWYGNIFLRSGYKCLDCSAFMDTTMPDDALATDWLNAHVKGMPVVLEANGDSYTDYERVSVMTGLPTVLGWHTHEWLWKSDPVILDKRAADIKTIYTSTNEEEVRSLIEKYHIRYIYVGKLEKEKYTTINSDLLNQLGSKCFDSPAVAGKTYETYIIKIKQK
jgi:uncharacterized membrane protein